MEFNQYIRKKIKSTNLASEPIYLEELIEPAQRNQFIEYFKEFSKNKSLEPSLFNTVYNSQTMVNIVFYNEENFLIFFVEEQTLRLPLYKFLHEQRIYSLGELTGSIAHDFNNHVMVILSTVDILLEKYIISSTDKTNSHLMTIKHNASRVINLIKQILNASHKAGFDTEDIISVNEYINDFFSGIGRILTTEVEVKITTSSTIPYICMNDTHLEQILINLINNAKYAIKKTQNPPIITISTDVVVFDRFFVENGFCISKGKYARITVEDRGCGISADNIKKIFEPFFTTKSKDGTGLGLFSVNVILKKYKGFIKIKSLIGSGSKFMVHIPYSQTNKQEQQIAKKFANKKILFVEDDESIRLFVKSSLADYDIVFCADSIEAFNKASELEKIDILVTDLMLSTLSGIDLYNKIKPKFPSMNVLFISGYGKSIVNVPNSYFLQKPFSIKDLKNLIDHIMQQE